MMEIRISEELNNILDTFRLNLKIDERVLGEDERQVYTQAYILLCKGNNIISSCEYNSFIEVVNPIKIGILNKTDEKDLANTVGLWTGAKVVEMPDGTRYGEEED
jgi:hypothetical protein